MEVVLSIKELYTETRAFLEGKAVSGRSGERPEPPPEAPLRVAAVLGMVPVPHSWTRHRRRRRCMAP